MTEQAEQLQALEELSDAVPSFAIDWKHDDGYWTDDGAIIGHAVVGSLAHHVTEVLASGSAPELDGLALTIERLLRRHGPWDLEYVGTGLLEGLINILSWLPPATAERLEADFGARLHSLGVEAWSSLGGRTRGSRGGQSTATPHIL